MFKRKFLIKSDNKYFGWLFRRMNNTPFDGTVLFQFEPYHLFGNGQPGILVKSMWRVFGYILTCRMIPNADGIMLKDRVLKMVEAGVKFGYVIVNKHGDVIDRQLNISPEKLQKMGAQQNCISGCFNASSEFIGDLVATYRLVVQGYRPDRIHMGIWFHRAKAAYCCAADVGTLFSLGNMEFDRYWKPDHANVEWKWVMRFCKIKGIKKVPLSLNDFYSRGFSVNDIIKVIPYNQRGDKKIENLNQAKYSARKLQEYISQLEHSKN